MREILYRAISMATGEHWLYGQPRHYARNPHTEKWTIYDPSTGIETDIDEETLGEYTGKEIDKDRLFDGDICKFKYIPNPHFNNPNEYNVTAVVEWSESNCWFILRNLQPSSKSHPSRKQYFSLGDYRISGLTIIGNRWDNPDLLKGGDK